MIIFTTAPSLAVVHKIVFGNERLGAAKFHKKAASVLSFVPSLDQKQHAKTGKTAETFAKRAAYDVFDRAVLI